MWWRHANASAFFRAWWRSATDPYDFEREGEQRGPIGGGPANVRFREMWPWEQERLHAAKKTLAHQLQASTLPGGTAKGDPLQVFRRHDKEGKEGLSLEQFSAAIRRDGKLGRSKLSEKEVSQLFASLDTENAGVVKIEKLSSLVGRVPTRQPLGEVAGNGTPTPRDRQRRGKPAGKKAARRSTRAKLSIPSRALAEKGVTDSSVTATTSQVVQGTNGDVDAEAMLAAAASPRSVRELLPIALQRWDSQS